MNATDPIGSGYPDGVLNANRFGYFNALSFQITLGSPMILFAQSLGAGATILGLIAALTPLLTIFQIPAAHYIPLVGYKRLILLGWSLRTVLIFLLALVPPAIFLGKTTQIALVLVALFLFNLLRGISSGAWLPWITELIPEELRARFLARDQVFQQLGSLSALLIAGFVLWGKPTPWQFAAVFLLSAGGGTASLYFLKRIPDVASEEVMQRSGHRVPWRAMIAYPPFLRLLIFNLLFVFTVGGLGAFTVSFLKSTAGFSEASILLLICLNFIGAVLVFPLLRSGMERFGPRPVLMIAMGLFTAVIAGWWTLAAGVLTATPVMVGVLQFFSGIAGTSFNVANSTHVMRTMPAMGRNHFFALFAVVTGLGLGCSPVLWGLLIDRIGAFSTPEFAADWNAFSIYFSAAAIIGLATMLYALALTVDASPALTVGAPAESILVARIKRFARYWQR